LAYAAAKLVTGFEGDEAAEVRSKVGVIRFDYGWTFAFYDRFDGIACDFEKCVFLCLIHTNDQSLFFGASFFSYDLDNSGHNRENDNYQDDEREITFDNGEISEEVAAENKERNPEQAANDVVGE
jgi:hypothetical protein